MNIIVNAAESFMGLFDAGALTFVNWVSTIVPKVLLLLVFMNALIALIGQERINKFAKLCSCLLYTSDIITGNYVCSVNENCCFFINYLKNKAIYFNIIVF